MNTIYDLVVEEEIQQLRAANFKLRSDIIDDNYSKFFDAIKRVPPGPWKCHARDWEYNKDAGDMDSRCGCAVFTKHGECLVDNGSVWGDYRAVATADMLHYIALLDPDTVRTLVDKAKRYDKLVAKGIVDDVENS